MCFPVFSNKPDLLWPLNHPVRPCVSSFLFKSRVADSLPCPIPSFPGRVPAREPLSKTPSQVFPELGHPWWHPLFVHNPSLSDTQTHTSVPCGRGRSPRTVSKNLTIYEVNVENLPKNAHFRPRKSPMTQWLGTYTPPVHLKMTLNLSKRVVLISIELLFTDMA